VIEIDTAAGLGYAQYTHRDPLYGELIRVLPGVFAARPASFEDLVRQRERFHAFFPAQLAASRGLVRIVSNQPVPPEAERFPLMRSRGVVEPSGRVSAWWLRDGERAWRIGDLGDEHKKLSIAEILTDVALAERIATGWQPSDEA
jgi:hypothetical protein